MRRLSLGSGHRERWLVEALQLERRPRGWTIDLAEELASALGTTLGGLLDADYDPTAEPAPPLSHDG